MVYIAPISLKESGQSIDWYSENSVRLAVRVSAGWWVLWWCSAGDPVRPGRGRVITDVVGRRNAVVEQHRPHEDTWRATPVGKSAHAV